MNSESTGCILITGGGGFLAQWLYRCLTNQNIRVYRLFHKQADISTVYDYSSLQALQDSGLTFETIFHLAAHIPYGQMNVPDKRLVESNIMLTHALVKAFPAARIVYASSVAVYGTPLSLPIRLNSVYNNPDFYGSSKLAAETIVRNYGNYAIIRFTSLIGPAMREISFVPIVLASAVRTGVISIKGTGARTQNYLDVRDAARLCLELSSVKKNLTVLGVTRNAYSNKEIADRIAQLTHAKIRYEGVDQAPSFVYETQPENDFDFQSEYDIQKTLEDMYFHVKHGISI